MFAFLERNQLGTISVKSESKETKSLEGVSILKQIIYVFFYLSSGGHFVHRSRTVLAN